MLCQQVTVTAPDGLHARPAGELVRLVKESGALVTLSTAQRKVNASSLLSILSLGLKQGTTVEVCVEGGNEAAVLQAVAELIAG